MAPQTQEIRSLTGLRGVAALVVVAFHLTTDPICRTRQPFLVGPGYLSVDLFFMLSGFVMAMNYGGRFRHGFDRRGYLTFLQARFSRVYPLYILVTGVVFVLDELFKASDLHHLTVALVSNVLSVQGLGVGLIVPSASDDLVAPMWSVSVEVGAYLLFPALVAVTLFRSRKSAMVAAVACFCFLSLLQFVPTSWIDQDARRGPLDISLGPTLWPLGRCLAGFILGLVSWRVSQNAHVVSLKRPEVLDALLILLLAGLWHVRGADLAIICLFPLLILQISTDTSPLARLLGCAPIYRLGELSFAIYLIHAPLRDFLGTPLTVALRIRGLPHPWALSSAVVVGSTLGLAWPCFVLVEKPARRFLRARFDRPMLRIDPEPVAP